MDTPLDKKLIGNQNKLPEALKNKIEAAPESPVKFMGGIAASVARSGSGGGSGLLGDINKGILGKAQRIIAEKEQSDYRANANVGDPFFKPGVERVKPEQRTDSASYGNKSVFSPQQNSYGNYLFGNQEQRQMSMPNRGNIEGPLFMEDLSGDGNITQKDVGIGQGWIKPDKK